MQEAPALKHLKQHRAADARNPRLGDPWSASQAALRADEVAPKRREGLRRSALTRARATASWGIFAGRVATGMS
jgi:hypothetical protein